MPGSDQAAWTSGPDGRGTPRPGRPSRHTARCLGQRPGQPRAGRSPRQSCHRRGGRADGGSSCWRRGSTSRGRRRSRLIRRSSTHPGWLRRPSGWPRPPADRSFVRSRSGRGCPSSGRRCRSSAPGTGWRLVSRVREPRPRRSRASSGAERPCGPQWSGESVKGRPGDRPDWGPTPRGGGWQVGRIIRGGRPPSARGPENRLERPGRRSGAQACAI